MGGQPEDWMMRRRPRVSERTIIFAFGVILSLGLICGFFFLDRVNAQSDTAVRSELVSLRNRVTRLENEIRGLSPRRESTPRVPPRRSGTGTVNGETVGQSDPLFERLSILVIELKEEVKDLDRRLKILEAETVRRVP
jgi:hypothetical protein